jgi:hypothetical protein
MKLPKPRGMTQRPNEELRWRFQDADAACGQRGQSLEPSTGGGTVDHHPSDDEIRAARRVSRIDRALAELTGRQKEVLRECYTAPAGTEQGYGAGDGAVLNACNASAELRELQARYDTAKPAQKQERKERLDAARNQIARDTMGEVKVAHRDYVAVRRRHRQAERELEQQAETAEQRLKAVKAAEEQRPIVERRAVADAHQEQLDRACELVEHARGGRLGEIQELMGEPC